MIICDYWSYLIRTFHRIIDILFDDYWIDYLPPIIPIIQRVKTKCEYLVHFWQRFWHMTSVIICDYLWLFDDYLKFVTLKCERERLTRLRIRQAMLPHNTGGQACTFSEDGLRFACFIAAKRPPCTTAVNTSHPADNYLIIIWLICDYLWLFDTYLIIIWIK